MTWPIETGTFELGDLPVERGGVIRDAKLSYQTHGTLNDSRDNVIAYPCSYGATHESQNWLIGPDMILDPTRYFIVIPDMFSNSESSSAADIDDFPAVVTAADNVHAQHRLFTHHLGVRHLQAAYGFSMGAIQSYHWAALYPDFVERAIIVCGSARTAIHNKVFLSGLLRILEAAPEYIGNGRFSREPTTSVRAYAHVYAAWGLSQDFYRAELFRTALGSPDWQSFVQTDWVENFAQIKAANHYSQATTWLESDISGGGDLATALGAIQARVLLMPSETDLYFRVADNAAELPHLKAGELRPIPSIWGHRAGSPDTTPVDLEILKTAVWEWLDK